MAEKHFFLIINECLFDLESRNLMAFKYIKVLEKAVSLPDLAASPLHQGRHSYWFLLHSRSSV